MEGSRRPVSLILSDAVRETNECVERLAQVVRDCEEALLRAKDEHKEAEIALKGLQKLHIQSTKSLRQQEHRALVPHEPPVARNKAIRGATTTKILGCLGSSLDMLTKEQIIESTDLAPHIVGVVLGHALRSGKVIEREGLFGVAQKLGSADDIEHELIAASAASNGR